MTVPDEMESYAEAVGPDPDAILEEMDARAEETGFPTVGPAVGGWLYLLAKLVDAERIFEFGSGFGYSAYWFCRGLSEGDEIVLTEIDADELEDAREYLARGGFDDRATFELGDAIETVEAFEAVRGKIPVGGIVVADNMTAGPFDFETVRRAFLEGEAVDNASAEGVADYLEHVDATADFETALLPLGEGVAVSRRR